MMMILQFCATEEAADREVDWKEASCSSISLQGQSIFNFQILNHPYICFCQLCGALYVPMFHYWSVEWAGMAHHN